MGLGLGMAGGGVIDFEGGGRSLGFGIGLLVDLSSISMIVGLVDVVAVVYDGGADLLKRQEGTLSVRQDTNRNSSTISPAHILTLSHRRDFLNVVRGTFFRAWLSWILSITLHSSSKRASLRVDISHFLISAIAMLSFSWPILNRKTSDTPWSSSVRTGCSLKE